MRIWPWLLNVWYMIFFTLNLFLCSWLSMLRISHPFVGFRLCHFIGWYRCVGLRTRDRREYSRVAWRFLVLCLLLESSCRLWFRILTRFLFSFFCWIILRNHNVYDDIPCDVEMLVLCCLFYTPLRLFMNFENELYMFWIIESVTSWTLYLSIELLFNIVCRVWECYIKQLIFDSKSNMMLETNFCHM
jgi:hypothetical protein